MIQRIIRNGKETEEWNKRPQNRRNVEFACEMNGSGVQS